MNRLSTKDRASILTAISEGMGINAACRITGVSKNTVLKLLADVGRAVRAITERCFIRSVKLNHYLRPASGVVAGVFGLITVRGRCYAAKLRPT